MDIGLVSLADARFMRLIGMRARQALLARFQQSILSGVEPNACGGCEFKRCDPGYALRFRMLTPTAITTDRCVAVGPRICRRLTPPLRGT